MTHNPPRGTEDARSPWQCSLVIRNVPVLTIRDGRAREVDHRTAFKARESLAGEAVPFANLGQELGQKLSKCLGLIFRAAFSELVLAVTPGLESGAHTPRRRSDLRGTNKKTSPKADGPRWQAALRVSFAQQPAKFALTNATALGIAMIGDSSGPDLAVC
jgi:hypothetical protein